MLRHVIPHTLCEPAEKAGQAATAVGMKNCCRVQKNTNESKIAERCTIFS